MFIETEGPLSELIHGKLARFLDKVTQQCSESRTVQSLGFRAIQSSVPQKHGSTRVYHRTGPCTSSVLCPSLARGLPVLYVYIYMYILILKTCEMSPSVAAIDLKNAIHLQFGPLDFAAAALSQGTYLLVRMVKHVKQSEARSCKVVKGIGTVLNRCFFLCFTKAWLPQCAVSLSPHSLPGPALRSVHLGSAGGLLG